MGLEKRRQEPDFPYKRERKRGRVLGMGMRVWRFGGQGWGGGVYFGMGEIGIQVLINLVYGGVMPREKNLLSSPFDSQQETRSRSLRLRAKAKHLV